MLKSLGKDGWKKINSEESYKDLREPDVPTVFLFIYNAYLEIYNGMGESLTWTDIESYAKLRKIDFTQFELNYLWKINGWANEQIKELKKGED